MDSWIPASIALALTTLGLYAYYTVVLRPAYSILSVLPGPPSQSLAYGNLKEVLEAEPGLAHQAWTEKYGSGVIRYTGFFGADRLLIADPVALNHILLANPYDFPKPNSVRGNLSRILGKGILFAEGDDHKRQRRIMGPAFNGSGLGGMVATFQDKTKILREKWIDLFSSDEIDLTAFKEPELAKMDREVIKEKSKLNRGGVDDGEVDEITINVSGWMSRVTLDIIGSTGFGYEFNSLEDSTNVLAAAFASLLPSPTAVGKKSPEARSFFIQILMSRLLNWFPWLAYVPLERIKKARVAFEVMERESLKILDEKRKAFKEGGNQLDGAGKDLISILLRSNIADARSQMSDSELQGQMTTFTLAGHETTSTALTWTLWTLAKLPRIQEKLRKEIRQARKDKGLGRDDNLAMDDLNKLEYLDAVCREILRVEAPVSATIRSSTYQTTIPLSKPILSPKTNQMISSFVIPADQVIFLSVSAVNKNKEVFGDDAEEFRPERWLDGSLDQQKGEDGTTKSVGVWAGLLTFLAGPRACIGYKFAVLELKAILLVLIDEFEFIEREPGMPITRRSALVTRPVVDGEEDLGFRMPLRVRRAKRDGEE